MNSSLDKVWKDRPETIRKYYSLLPLHERLCNEVHYILEAKLTASDIETAHITSRAKTLPSFCEKIERKSYTTPFQQITDFSGVRVVFYTHQTEMKLRK